MNLFWNMSRMLMVCWLLAHYSLAQTNDGLFKGINFTQDSLLIARQIASFESLHDEGQISTDSLAKYYTSLADQYKSIHAFGQARQYLQHSFRYALKDTSRKVIARNHLMIANMAMEEDDRTEALERLNTALEIYGMSGDSINYLQTLRLIGINYDYVDEHETAREYYDECIALAARLDRPQIIGACYNTIGGMYSQDGSHRKAIEFFELGIEMGKQIDDKNLLHKLYHNASLAYNRLEVFGEAKVFLDKSLDMALQIEDQKCRGFSYQGYGLYYQTIGKLDSAEFYMNKTLQIAEKIKNAQLRSNAMEVLEDVYYKTGRYQQAYDISKLNQAEEDSLFNIENSQIIQTIREKYQTEKRERELAEKNLQLKEAGFSLDRQQSLQTTLFVLLAMLLVILFLIYRGYVLRKRANDLLRIKNKEIETHVAHVEKLNNTKSRWFINVAHELRTPLTLIKGPVNRVIREYDLHEEVKEDLMLVERNANSLTNLVDEILELSKLEEGSVKLSDTVFNICELARQTVNSFESRAEQLGLQLVYKCPEDVFVKADRDKINKILINLISNAMKFTPKGGLVEVFTQVNADIELRVKDTGVGIKQEDIPFVFDRFFQSSDPDHNAYGGTGIGLSLSKEIAEMHEGQLLVSSQKGVGSVFSLILPLSRRSEGLPVTTDPEKEQTHSPLPLGGDKKASLLLVEDNDDMRRYLASLLSGHFDVIEATDGESALEIMRMSNIRFIISDVMMAGMDGISFLKKVKADPMFSHLPFIHLSALSDDKIRKEALRIGIDDFLIKPFDPEELIIRVKNLYDNYLARSARDITSEEVSYDERIVKKLHDEVMEHIEDSHFNVLRLANGAAMSERQLYRYLKNATGLTPLQFIQEIKLTRAIELARNKVYTSTGELAAAVGFRQASYFSTLFQKRFGKKPTALLKD